MSKKRFMFRGAVYLMPIKDGQILLLRRFNTGWEDGKYSLVAGHVDGNEPVTQAMTREASEEAGINVASKDLKMVHAMHRNAPYAEYLDFFFVADRWQGEPKIMETDKCDDLSWFDLDNLPDNVLEYVKQAIDSYRDNIPFSEYGFE